MESEDFFKIEKELNIKLPKEYIDLVLQNPFKEKKYDVIKGALLTDIKKIISINKKIRTEGYNKQKWAEDNFIIGNEREDTYSFINLKQKGELKVYGVISEDQKDNTKIKKVTVGSNLFDYIEGKKNVAKCL